jgi:hypothetical protein
MWQSYHPFRPSPCQFLPRPQLPHNLPQQAEPEIGIICGQVEVTD